MVGKNVIATMYAKFAETNARITESGTEAQAVIESLRAELRIQRWLLGLLVALAGVFVTVVVVLVRYLLPGDPAPNQSTVATAVAEELDPSLPARDRS